MQGSLGKMTIMGFNNDLVWFSQIFSGVDIFRPWRWPSWAAQAALKPYAEKTKSGDLSVIEGPCIGTLAKDSRLQREDLWQSLSKGTLIALDFMDLRIH